MEAISKVWASRDLDNPTICVNLTDEARDWLEGMGVEISGVGCGAGVDGMINSQLPVNCGDAQQYIGGDLADDVLDALNDSEKADEVRDWIHDLLREASSLVDWRKEAWHKMFGTDNIESHDNGLLHGYYDGSRLALLENLDTGEAYIGLELGAQDDDYYAPGFMTFKDLQKAIAFIENNIKGGETLQDFNITHRIVKQLPDEDG